MLARLAAGTRFTYGELSKRQVPRLASQALPLAAQLFCDRPLPMPLPIEFSAFGTTPIAFGVVTGSKVLKLPLGVALASRRPLLFQPVRA